MGEKIPIQESEKREERYLSRGNIWCFRVNRRWSRDANVGGNDARFINHSCTPNCYSMIIGHTILICAGRNIAGRRGADLQLLHRRRRRDSLSLPTELQESALRWDATPSVPAWLRLVTAIRKSHVSGRPSLCLRPDPDLSRSQSSGFLHAHGYPNGPSGRGRAQEARACAGCAVRV